MAVTFKAYGLFLQSILEGRVDLRTDPLMCMIVKSDYTPNQDTHKFRSVVTNEITGSGYVSGGKQVTGVSLSYTASTNALTIGGGNLVWPGVTWTGARYGVLYVAREGVPITAQPLVAYIDFGADVNRTDAPFYINWSVNGITSLSVPA
jgi:hypothetical protein